MAEPCAVRTTAAIKNAIGINAIWYPAVNSAILALMPVCWSVPPKAPPAAVINMIPPPLIKAVCTNGLKFCPLSFLFLAMTPNAATPPKMMAMFLSPKNLMTAANWLNILPGSTLDPFKKLVIAVSKQMSTRGIITGNKETPNPGKL